MLLLEPNPTLEVPLMELVEPLIALVCPEITFYFPKTKFDPPLILLSLEQSSQEELTAPATKNRLEIFFIR
jgi:hypothetical protein